MTTRRGWDRTWSLACYTVAAVPVQALARRLGLPYSSPAPTARLLLVPATLAVAAVSATAGVAVAQAAGRGTGATARALRPLRAGLVGALPVLGPLVTLLAELRTSRRLAGAGGGAWVRTALSAAVLAGLRVLTYRTLAAVLDAGQAASPPPPPPLTQLNVRPADVAPGHEDGFIVYFDGVGRVVPRTTPAGRRFAAAMAHRLPRWAVVMSLMPNDVTQQPAWRRPLTGPLWRRLMRRDPRWLIGRGVWEAVVALDRRYRDRLAADHTTAVLAHLAAAGYRPGSGVPVVFVGLSAASQTGLRCASDVARALGAPLDVVGIGAFCDGAADLSAVRRVHSAVSWGDSAEMAPVLFCSSRWTALGVGAWSRARRRRTVIVHRHDWATHVGRTGYLGEAITDDGRTRLGQAADLVARAARELDHHSHRRRTSPAAGTP